MDDLQQIIQAVDEGYIRGIHREGDRALIEKHFHNEFSMFLRDEHDQISIMKIGEWITRIEKRKADDPNAYINRDVSYVLRSVNVYDGFATVLLDLYYNGQLYAIDHFSLYKLNGEWKFMAKLYKM